MGRIDAFLELTVKQGGSDLHIVSGEPPRIRLAGLLHKVRFRDLSVEDVERMLDEILQDRHREALVRRHSVDLAYEVPGLGRFRVNVHRHLGGVAAALRVVPLHVPDIEKLGLPSSVKLAAALPRGMILVTGPTGSGKSTTLAAMVDYINANRRGHIITIEDPIEFVHDDKLCTITQREIGLHASTFSEALRSAIRSDVDAIMVGELRDMETVSLALTAAEAGVQVLGTLHTNGATRSVDRFVNIFPAARQDEIRALFSECLQAIVSQQLVRRADGSGLVLAAEVVINTPASAAIIRAGQSHKLETVIQAGGRVGMQSLDVALRALVSRGVITATEAADHAVDRTKFDFHVLKEAAA